MLEWIAPPDIGLAASVTLIAVSAATSFLTAAAGIGGGMVLIAVMAVLIPVQALIPLHGVVQIGSNLGRALIMLREVQRHVLLPFALGSLIGASLGGLTVVQLPAWALKIGLGLFILWSVWAPAKAAVGRGRILFAGVFSSFLTMFFGATGAFVSSMVKTLKLGRLEHVATHSACMVAQHVIKVVAFGLLGFAYGPYLGLVGAMIVSGFLGTVIGKRLLMRMKDENFHRILSIILSLLAAKLIFDGASLLM